MENIRIPLWIIITGLFLQTGVVFSNQAPLVDSTDYSPANVINPGQTVTITVTAHDPDCTGSCTSGCGQYIRSDLTQWTVTDPQGNTTTLTSGVDKGTGGSPYTTTVTWTAPPTTGAYTFHLSLSDSGSFMCGGRQTIMHDIPLSVAIGNPPVITSLVADPDVVFTNRKSIITAQAYDPDGDPITYSWHADGGLISTTDIPSKIEWIAPAVGGIYTITLSVEDINGLKSTRNVIVYAIIARFKTSITKGLKKPGRISIDESGNIYVTDQELNQVISFTSNGLIRMILPLYDTPLGIAVDDTGRIFAGMKESRAVYIFDNFGRFKGYLGSGTGEFIFPADIEVDKKSKRIYVADGAAGLIKVYNYGGSKIKEIPLNRFPSGIAVNPATGDFAVSCGAGNNEENYVFVYSSEGNLKTSFAKYASSPTPGRNIRFQGIAFDANQNVFVADPFLGWVQALDINGGHVAYIGNHGGGNNFMRFPSDVVVDKSGKLLVADSGNGRIDIYEFVTAIPASCSGDRDCDGMPDSWEIIYGLNPDDPSDYLLDSDGDTLTNLEEFLAGTDPTNRDSDGDGIPDGDEVRGGTNPYDNNIIPVADAGSDSVVNPAVVKLDGTKSYDPNGLPLTYKWTQLSGPVVELKDSTTSTPSFFAIKSGEYQFSLIVSNGKVNSKPDKVSVKVNNVPPSAVLPERIAGYMNESIVLDGSLSSDANGDELIYIWRQESGTPVVLNNSNTSQPYFVPEVPGNYVFSLAVSDGVSESKKAYVNVIVLTPSNLPPHAVIVPVPARVKAGNTIILDGSLSRDPEYGELSFNWEQISGPAIYLTNASNKKVTITPQDPGVYSFKLNVSDGVNTSSSNITFIVDSTDSHVPHAFAGYDMIAEKGERVCLNGTLSYDADGDILTYSWRQIEGVSVDLDSSASATPCFVPVWSGMYKFGLTVNDGKHVSLEDELSVFVRDDSENIPIINRIPPVWGTKSIPVKVSSDFSGDLIVEQIDGPPVPFTKENSAIFFIPYLPGVYAFKFISSGENGTGFERIAHAVVEEFNLRAPVPVVQGSVMAELKSSGIEIDASESISNNGGFLSFIWLTDSGRFIDIQNPEAERLNVYPETGRSYRFKLSLNNGELLGLRTDVILSVADKFSEWIEIDNKKGGSIRYKDAEIVLPPQALFEDSRIAVGKVKLNHSITVQDGKKILDEVYFIAPEGINFIKDAILYIGKREGTESVVYIDSYGNIEKLESEENGQTGFKVKIKRSGLYALVREEHDEQRNNTDARCFIASAAFSPNALPVKILREFRDKYLVRNEMGKKFVEFYYRVSPEIADSINDSKGLRYTTRIVLYPVVGFAWVMLNIPWLLIVFAVTPVLVYIKRKG